MDILKGVVSKLKSTIEISGGGRDSSVTTTHVTIFHLDGQPVKIKSREAVIVDNSDNMTVAGKVRNGVFNAYAYINNTTGVSGNIGLAIHYFFLDSFSFCWIICNKYIFRPILWCYTHNSGCRFYWRGTVYVL